LETEHKIPKKEESVKESVNKEKCQSTPASTDISDISDTSLDIDLKNQGSLESADKKQHTHIESVTSVTSVTDQFSQKCQKCGAELKGGFFKRNDGSLWCLECMRKEHAPDTNQSLFICSKCNTKFFSAKDLKDHYEACHNKEEGKN
jgi:ribosomal protein L37AE/L43A